MMVLTIPPEIVEDMDISDSEMIDVRLTKKMHVPTEHVIVRQGGKVYIPTDTEVAELFR
jgi:hypothetical protein